MFCQPDHDPPGQALVRFMQLLSVFWKTMQLLSVIRKTMQLLSVLRKTCRKVPACICQLTAIVKLSLACNQLTELPAAIGNLTTLSFLDVSFNQLQGLPKELAKLDGLSAFNASFNDLGLANQGAMPPVLFELTSLKELNLDYSGITKISPALGNLRQLEGLQVSLD